MKAYYVLGYRDVASVSDIQFLIRIARRSGVAWAEILAETKVHYYGIYRLSTRGKLSYISKSAVQCVKGDTSQQAWHLNYSWGLCGPSSLSLNSFLIESSYPSRCSTHQPVTVEEKFSSQRKSKRSPCSKRQYRPSGQCPHKFGSPTTSTYSIRPTPEGASRSEVYVLQQRGCYSLHFLLAKEPASNWQPCQHGRRLGVLFYDAFVHAFI